MNSIITAKALASKTTFAGRNWFYDFRELPQSCDERKFEKTSTKLSTRYSKITKAWDKDRNSEWICRIYLSAKMIMTATLQLNALAYGHDKNLRLISPYLAYYSFLSLLRGIVYTLPEVKWDDGQLVRISHSKAIELACAHIASFDKVLANSIKQKTIELKAARELISYRSPSSGDRNIPTFQDIETVATLLAELAQFNSEILEASIIKKADGKTFEFRGNYITDLSDVTIEGINFFDKEDLYRLNYLKRKYPLPPNILHIMTEGHVEDFFGAWIADEDTEDTFNPDEGWQLIFDIP